ncbi:J domain-containing protein [Diplocloster modestus]|uniref:J domain-containing protein n=1 Tax=Diplocloster modestus TaxID=2850322 RepID=A0ABS6K6X8_9FIRM|nr:J domain-containing protein [Diplocloster modestus]MBU9726286.1 J domain-containing protein [Diplocloster modestus]
MITDPYSILGVNRNASNDEVKKAYREQLRKYHPDSYVGNPLSGLAEEKFKEVQEAYDQIMKEREGGYGGYNSYGGPQQSQQTYGGSQDDVELNAVVNYVNSGHYQEALNMLSRIQNRSARWYYCSAAANAGVGNNVVAVDHARQAVNMEPGNPQYNQLLNQLQWNSQRYQQGSYGNRGGGLPTTGNCCCDLWIADSCCECMGGDLCSCM